LLWPLAAAAPWLARLALRDRLRLTGAVLLLVAVIVPRIINGLTEGATMTTTFEIKGVVDALGYALARAGQAPPFDYVRDGLPAWTAGTLVVALIAAAALLRPYARCQLRNVGVALVLVILPILALLSGGRGIRERHVITVQVVLAFGAAAGLGALLTANRWVPLRVLGGLAALALVWLSIEGDRALLSQPDEWLHDVGRYAAGAELLMIVPRNAQLPITAMLTGDAPSASAPVAWPPVCESDSEWWCRQLDDGRRVVAVDDVSDAVVDAASRAARSVWVFDLRNRAINGHVPARLDACKRVRTDVSWMVLECAAADLQRGDHAA